MAIFGSGKVLFTLPKTSTTTAFSNFTSAPTRISPFRDIVGLGGARHVLQLGLDALKHLSIDPKVTELIILLIETNSHGKGAMSLNMTNDQIDVTTFTDSIPRYADGMPHYSIRFDDHPVMHTAYLGDEYLDYYASLDSRVGFPTYDIELRSKWPNVDVGHLKHYVTLLMDYSDWCRETETKWPSRIKVVIPTSRHERPYLHDSGDGPISKEEEALTPPLKTTTHLRKKLRNIKRG